MKLTYWVSECLNDSHAYNVRAKTKKEVVHQLREHYNASGYGPVKKVTVEYFGAFDLLIECLSEDGGYWE